MSREVNDGNATAALEWYREQQQAGTMPGLSLSGLDELLASSARFRLADFSRADTSRLELLAGTAEGFGTLADVDPELMRSSVLAFRLVSANRVGPCEDFPYDAFWSFSLARAVACQAIAQELGLENHRELFLASFFQRIGALAFAGGFPTRYPFFTDFTGALDADACEKVLDLERERFGVDHLEVSCVLLRELGFPESCVGLVEERRFGSEDSEEGRLLRVAEWLAHLCSLDDEEREQRWIETIDARQELGLERDTFSALGDRVLHSWWEWGDELGVHTRPMTSFYALDQTTTYDRQVLRLPTAPEPEEDEDRGLRVLVVDDDPTAVLLVREQLRRAGHDVRTATDGEEALRLVQQHPVDVVVADWMMPEMDGLELCRSLRRFEAGRHLFFVLVTGREEEDDVVRAFDAGVDDFLNKPPKPGVLLARMVAARRVLDLRRKVELEQRQNKQQLAEMSRFAERLKNAASTDALTELPNRRYAMRRLQEEWATSERSGSALSLVMLDVDHFKRVNDTYGHEVGDDVLRAVADVLRQSTRRGEVACRFGGEEFIVICSSSDAVGVGHCGERVRKAIQEAVGPATPVEGDVTASIGVATRLEDMDGPEALIRAADRAVYQAKATGRNRTCTDPGENGTADGPDSEKGSFRGGAEVEGDEAA